MTIKEGRLGCDGRWCGSNKGLGMQVKDVNDMTEEDNWEKMCNFAVLRRRKGRRQSLRKIRTL